MSVLTGNIWSRHFLLIVFAGLPNDATCKQLYRNNEQTYRYAYVVEIINDKSITRNTPLKIGNRSKYIF
jgi:hypothetical protein